jgi:hypothetical protein
MGSRNLLCSVILAAVISMPSLFCQAGRRSIQTSWTTERAVLEKLAMINVAALTYYSWLKEIPSSLRQLGPTRKAFADREAADLIPYDLAEASSTGTDSLWRPRQNGGGL